MKNTCVQSLRAPNASRQAWSPLQRVASGASAAFMAGLLSLSAIQMAASGVATAAPVGQTDPTPRYFSVANYANSPLYNPADLTNYPGIQKFIDGLPGLNAAGENNLGQFIPVAVPDTTTYLGSDYYEIAIVEYTEKMHSDLPPTKLRGYVQLDTSVIPGNGVALTNPDGSAIKFPNGTQAYGVTKAHYLGPLLSATKDRPVRIKFYNLLPTGDKGNLFVPVDTSVMGSGPGPALVAADPDPQNPQCGVVGLKPAGC
ncbi:MAG: hypothetical protein JZU65_11955, partial [Chlorobium sp.]|nr:hypothetical protein [Chlorobium sp.]